LQQTKPLRTVLDGTLLSGGNFKKGEVKFLDEFDIDKAMKNPVKRKELEKPVKKCLNILKYFCVDHMNTKVISGSSL
jgi:hypothetical protein